MVCSEQLNFNLFFSNINLLFGFLVSGDNMLGFNGREAQLAGRVREMEEQNYLLRHQLSLSQGQLVQAMKQAVINNTTEAPTSKCTRVIMSDMIVN